MPCLPIYHDPNVNTGFVDLDEQLELELGHSIKEHVQRDGAADGGGGWADFRAREADVLARALAPGGALSTGYVIACGGGVVETAASVELLAAHRPVVWLKRHATDIVAYLEGKDAAAALAAGEEVPGGRPQYAGGEGPAAVLARRAAHYAAAADFEFAVAAGDGDWPAIARDFAALLGFAAFRSPAAAAGGADRPGRGSLVPDLAPAGGGGTATTTTGEEEGRNTFFLSLTHGDVADAASALPALCADVDALELRVDLLDCVRNAAADLGGGGGAGPAERVLARKARLEAVAAQVALLRRQLLLQQEDEEAGGAGPTTPWGRPLPVIFTLRTSEQGGAFAGSEAEVFELLRAGLRAGCEWVDVEYGNGCWSARATEEFLALSVRLLTRSLLAID